MKKLIIIFFFSLVILTACQKPEPMKNSPEEVDNGEKATTSSSIILNIKDPQADIGAVDQKLPVQ